MSSTDRIRQLEAELSELRSSRSYRIGRRIVTLATSLLPGHVMQRLRERDSGHSRSGGTDVTKRSVPYHSLPIQNVFGAHPSADAPRLGILLLGRDAESALGLVEDILAAQLAEQCVQLLVVVDCDVFKRVRRSGLVIERLTPRSEWGRLDVDAPYSDYLAGQLSWLRRAYNLDSFILDLGNSPSFDVLTSLFKSLPREGANTVN